MTTTAPASDPFADEYPLPDGISAASAPDPFADEYPLPSEPAPGSAASIGPGVWQGVKDVSATVFGALHRGAEYLAPQEMAAVEKEYGLNSAAQAQQLYQQERDKFNATSGRSWGGYLGRIAGQVATAGPAIEAAAPLIGGAVGSVGGGALGDFVIGQGGSRAAGYIPAASRLASRMFGGATQGAEVAGLTSAQSDAPLADQMTIGGLVGAAVPGALGLASGAKQVAGNMLTRALANEGAIDPVTARLAASAERLGIPVRAAQISSNYLIRKMDDLAQKFPFLGYKSDVEAQHSGFNRALSNTFGEDAPALTENVMANAYSRIGSVFDRVYNNTTLAPDNELGTDLTKIADGAARGLTSEADKKQFETGVQQVMNAFRENGGQLPGQAFQDLTQTGGVLSDLTNSNQPTIAHWGQKLRSALEDAFQRQATPEDAADLAAARLQYKNLMAVEPLAAKSPTGDISPALLLNQVRKVYGNKAVATGRSGDIGQIAGIGQRFLKERPASGTPEGNLVTAILTGELGGPRAIAAGVGAATVGRGLMRFLNSPNMRNQLLRSAGVPEDSMPMPPALPPAMPNATSRFFLNPPPAIALQNQQAR